MHIAEFSTKNPVLMNLLMIAILVGGFLAALRLPLELFPSIKLELVTVTTIYPGASAEDVEQLVTIPIEDEINDLQGIKVIRSISSESLSRVIAEIEPGEDIQKISQDIRSEISKIKDDLPEDTEESVVEEIEAGFPLISIAIAGEVSPETLRGYALRLRDEIKPVPGVDFLVTSGMSDPVFWIYVQPEKLRQYNLSLEQIGRAIQQNNLDLPGGAFEQGKVEFQVRTKGRVQSVEDLLNIPVRDNPEGHHILIRDIARVELGEKKNTMLSRVNGLPAINFWIIKQKDIDAIDTVERIRDKVENFREVIPNNIEIYETNNTSYWVEQRFNTMVQSGIIGLIIVLIILAAFLDLRAASMAAIGIPVSFFGAFILMQLTGITLSLLSMFGLILVLGLIVDDAIIVSENIQRYLQAGLSPVDAAVKGTKEVALPVIATILTNIAAFIPLLIATGIIGKFLSIIPKVAIFALAVSLLEALFILPSHCAVFLRPLPKRKPIRRWVYKVRHYYLNVLIFGIRKRYVTVGSFILIFILTMIVVKQIPLVLFYTSDISQFIVRVENPSWSSPSATEESVKKIENVINKTIPPHVLKNVLSIIGIDISTSEIEIGDHLASVIVEYEDFEKRKENGIELMDKARKNIEKEVVGPASIEVIRSEGLPSGKPVYVQITGSDFETLKEISLRAQRYLGTLPGVYGISDNLVWGKPEIQVKVDEQRAAVYGLDTTTVARAIRAAAEGLIVSQTRLGEEEADIILQYDLPTGNIMSLLRSYQIRSSNGGWVPIDSIAEMSSAPSMVSISRYDMEHSVRITAEVDQKVTTAGEANELLTKRLDAELKNFPGYSYRFGGEEAETRESIDSIFRASIIAILLIYIILASILKSYTQPLVIMAVLPFALIGVAVGILLRGEPFSIPVLIGTVALLGVVINDSLLLMDFINKRYRKMNRIMAVAFSAKHRFRPIILTTVTTFGGLASLMLKTRGEAAFLAPMAIALGFGLVFATLITLLLIPCLYLILDDLHIYSKRKWQNWRRGEDVSLKGWSESGVSSPSTESER
ncbi:efflux RND transporter permease subunit [Desulfobacterota bacterium AH_259_B03_O07]|nr:efflux RND transporter permease subunit [Desulfobacterota bacterium AH_259_B03_O07]